MLQFTFHPRLCLKHFSPWLLFYFFLRINGPVYLPQQIPVVSASEAVGPQHRIDGGFRRHATWQRETFSSAAFGSFPVIQGTAQLSLPEADCEQSRYWGRKKQHCSNRFRNPTALHISHPGGSVHLNFLRKDWSGGRRSVSFPGFALTGFGPRHIAQPVCSSVAHGYK